MIEKLAVSLHPISTKKSEALARRRFEKSVENFFKKSLKKFGRLKILPYLCTTFGAEKSAGLEKANR
ncbi:MAG: hypothetical protein J1E04_06085 [Alistipes sp.]|nr:hypothetical protein [Alistipes sp.]